MSLVAQSPTKGFRGEHRLLPDELLTDVLSPDAQNCDYSRGTIKKRPGFVRLHNKAMLQGGISRLLAWKITDDFDFSGDFTLECHARFDILPTSNADLVDHFASTKGWILFWDSTNQQVEFDMVDSGAAIKTAVPNASVVWEAGKIYHIAARRTGTTIDLVVDGVAGTGVTCSGITAPTGGMNAAPAFTGTAVLDELRIWGDFRTTAELVATTHRELDDIEVIDANLSAYFKFNDATWFIATDSSGENLHGSFGTSTGAPTFTDGLVPNESDDSFAIRCDDRLTTVRAPYHADYAPILDTGDTWTIESWVRYDSEIIDGGERILHMGANHIDNGAVFDIYIDSSKNLKYNYSTTTTDSNVAVDTTYDVVVGTAFHLAITRNGTSIFTYINGALVHTETGVAAENGPTTATNDGMSFGRERDSGTQLRGAVTLDDVRLWFSSRSASQLLEWRDSSYVDTKDANLAGYWRFNSAAVARDETGRSDLTHSFDDASVMGWSRGLVYPQSPPPLLMCAPYNQPIESDEVAGGRNPTRRQLLCATHTNYWVLQNDTAFEVKRFVTDDTADQRTPGGTSKFQWTHFRTRLIACNGQEPNQLYGGDEVPHMVTFRAPTAGPTVGTTADSASLPELGFYTYVYSYRNSKNGVESPVSPETVSPEVLNTTVQIDISALDLDPPLGATHSRIYRKEPTGTEFMFLADVARGTSTYTDILGQQTTAQTDVTRAHLKPYRSVAVFGNRLWFGNTAASPSGLAFSEAGNENFLLASTILVDRGDGDEITGLLSAFGRLLIFKQFSIHELQGNTTSTFIVRKTVAGQGCISGNTLAESPNGIYYLSHDGVYLFNGQGITYVSANQQTEFAKIDPDKRREAVGAYDPETHQYVISLDFTDGRRTMVYDEETDSWAKWTRPFDYLVSAEHSSGKRELLGARNGYIHRLLEGTTDGSAVGSTESATLSGSLSGNATAVITDGAATFPTVGDGLAGVPLLAVNASDGAEQERLIIGNTATILYLDQALSPAVTGTYYIAPVNWFYETRWMDLGTTNTKRIMYVAFWLKENSSTVTLKWKTEEDETFSSTTFSTADEFLRVITDTRGRRLKLRFENISPSEAVEIESFQVEYSPKKRN